MLIKTFFISQVSIDYELGNGRIAVSILGLSGESWRSGSEVPEMKKYIIGIDEVGRGPIAGPVAVGAFVFLNDSTRKMFRGVRESKQLSEDGRGRWFEVIKVEKEKGNVDFSVSFQSNGNIDKKGISHCIKKALARSVSGLNIDCVRAKVLLDGGLKAPSHYRDQETIIKGDEKEMVIALASICAKVLRDGRMIRLGRKYPQYGFEIHKGYGTKAHYKAIKTFGLLKEHRRSFLKRLSTPSYKMYPV